MIIDVPGYLWAALRVGMNHTTKLHNNPFACLTAYSIALGLCLA